MISREWKESELIDESEPDLKGNFPVILVDRVNHAQVAAGNKFCFNVQDNKYATKTGEMSMFIKVENLGLM